jgi:hypothetical protein
MLTARAAPDVVPAATPDQHTSVTGQRLQNFPAGHRSERHASNLVHLAAPIKGD